jgi:hypothetical protein
MKTFFVIVMTTISFSSLYLASCNSAANKENVNGKSAIAEYDTIVGESFQPENILAVADLEGKMKGNESLELVIEGTVKSCCQKKGCWMRVDTGNGEAMMVTFKDYGFFVPFESAGKTAIMKGVAYYDTISVEMLKHYAEDAGKSEAEIAAITEPELAVSFEASGVMLK